MILRGRGEMRTVGRKLFLHLRRRPGSECVRRAASCSTPGHRVFSPIASNQRLRGILPELCSIRGITGGFRP